MKVDDEIESLRWLAREFDALSTEFERISVDVNQIKNNNLKRRVGGAPRNPAEPEEWHKGYLKNSQIKKLEFEDQLYKEAFWEFPPGGPSGPQQNEVVGFSVRELYGKNPDLLKRAFRALGMDKSQIHFMSQSVQRMCGEMYGFLDDRAEILEVAPPYKDIGRTILKVLADLCSAQAKKLKTEAEREDEIRLLRRESGRPKTLSKLDRAILVAIVLNPEKTQQEIAAKFKITQGTVSRSKKRANAFFAQKRDSVPKPKTLPTDPSILDQGKRADGRTTRQRLPYND